MELETTKKFLLVRAVEEADREGVVIALDERKMGDVGGSEDEALLDRAEKLYERIAAEHSRETQVAMAATVTPGWVLAVIVLAAFLLGLATKQLGPERRVNVLAFPLLGVVGWNLLIYFVTIGGALVGKKTSGGAGALSGLLKGLAERAMRRLEGGGTQPALTTGLVRFVSQWFELTGASRMVRLRGCLHLGAAALSLGVIAGMYWNGLAFQYLAAWESTFLGSEGVHGLFTVLFAPASALSGIAIPSLDEVTVMQLKTGSEGVSAAVWIHLFAITVGLFVVLPRVLLAIGAQGKAGRLERGIDFRESAGDYIERLLKTREGGNLVARLVPHRMELGSKERDRLRSFVHQLWGGQLWVEFSDPIAYGDEEEAVFAEGDFQMLVFNFSSTPEDESQGRLVKRFIEQLKGEGLILLEVGPFRERFGGLGEFERRLEERRSAWETILGRAGVGFALFDGDVNETRRVAGDVLLKPRKKLDA